MFVPRKVRVSSLTTLPQTAHVAPSKADDAEQLRADEEQLERVTQVVFETLSPIALNARLSISSITRDVVDYIRKEGSIHIARLLQIPPLQARCKNVAVLSKALSRLTPLPWLSLSLDDCKVTFHPCYMATLAVPLLQEQLVYVEALPPQCKSQVSAMTYLQDLLDEGMVLDMYEPTRSGLPPEQNAKKQWIAGRAFFLLSHASAAEALATKQVWQLSDWKCDRSPVRCLTFAQWTQLKSEYLALQQQPAFTGKRKLDDQESANQPWYRGTILLLPQSSDLTSVKARLEKVVPESVSYVHMQDEQVIVRTAHPRLAKQLLNTQSLTLSNMDADAEDRYWAGLPPKTRTLAQKRAAALEDGSCKQVTY